MVNISKIKLRSFWMFLNDEVDDDDDDDSFYTSYTNIETYCSVKGILLITLMTHH